MRTPFSPNSFTILPTASAQAWGLMPPALAITLIFFSWAWTITCLISFGKSVAYPAFGFFALAFCKMLIVTSAR